ncbi:sulfur carrier protein ThiS [Flavicella sediminum]|uniref:sulfur carrier protein ThiS n=1 Tax=Flavicella sediminum TaxID=2585141 RepID=UPI00111EC514|nr:sulfur carrier protein ThiS [Flavicella sediminum]
MISIQVNNSTVSIKENATIVELLHQINSPLNGIAVAIDATILPKETWGKTQLNNNDSILIIQATQGG